MKKVRTAIVGMGIGRPNGRAIAANPRGSVVALCDLLEIPHPIIQGGMAWVATAQLAAAVSEAGDESQAEVEGKLGRAHQLV